MYTLPRALLILVTVGLSLSKKKIGLFASMKNSLKMKKKNALISFSRFFSFSRYLNFCVDFLAMLDLTA